MRSVLMVMLKKEIKETLRDPKVLIGMILAPVLIMALMGVIMNFAITSTKEYALNPRVVILDYDNSLLSRVIIESLTSQPNSKVMVLYTGSIEHAIQKALDNGFPTVMVFPKGFEYNISIGVRAVVKLYTIMNTLSLAESGTSTIPSSLIDFLNSEIVNDRIKSLMPNIDPKLFLKPIEKIEYSIVKGKLVNIPPQMLSSIVLSQSIFIPMTIMIVFITAMQFASTSIALEKEYKTLETLLTLPVSRFTILIAKLISSVILAILGSISFMYAYTFYLTSTTSLGIPATISLTLSDIGLSITPLGFILVGLSLFLSITSSLVLALIIATFTEDVRSAQTLVGYLYFILIIPMIVTMFTDLSILPMLIQVILYAIPYTYTLTSVKAALLENYGILIAGIVYMSVFSIAILYIASKLFSSERILVMKISIKKFRRQR